ncbi:MAG: hypothetical protein J7621_05175 [Niastella sp.]|nr:hypothetical protein [Niastella sp.]
MKQGYLFKHWLTTLLLAPLMPSVYEFIFVPISGEIIELVDLYPVVFFYSLFFSLPTLIVYYIVFRLLNKGHVHPLLAKAILIGMSIAGICTTLLILGRGRLTETLILSFSVASIVAGCIFSIKSAPEAVGT